MAPSDSWSRAPEDAVVVVGDDRDALDCGQGGTSESDRPVAAAVAVHTRYYSKGALLLRACGSAEDPGSSEVETRREMEPDVARLAAVAESQRRSREQHGSTMDHLQTSARHATDPKRGNPVKRKERSVEAATWSWKKTMKTKKVPQRPIACLMD